MVSRAYWAVRKGSHFRKVGVVEERPDPMYSARIIDAIVHAELDIPTAMRDESMKDSLGEQRQRPDGILDVDHFHGPTNMDSWLSVVLA